MLVFVLATHFFFLAGNQPRAACSSDEVAALLRPAELDSSPFKLSCSLILPMNSVVTRQIIIEGSEASGLRLDCNGSTLTGQSKTPDFESIVIRSVKSGENEWSRPEGVEIDNCVIAHNARIYGLGRNGEAEQVRISSLSPGHTKRAQDAAPSNISFTNSVFKTVGGVPLYVGPGTTRISVTASLFEGKSNGPAVYLDAESAGSTIASSTFNIELRRETIAVDGSASNNISANRFINPKRGGIYLYRNCGEGGTIRHQKPEFNSLIGNSFKLLEPATSPAILLNSRGGRDPYCFIDPLHPFGSRLSILDNAQDNTIENNVASGYRKDAFVITGEGNVSQNNITRRLAD